MAVPALKRVESYRKAGKRPATVALDESLIAELDTIVRQTAKATRQSVMEEAIRSYVKHHPEIQQAKERAEQMSRAWILHNIPTLKALQGHLSDAAFARQVGLTESQWRTIKTDGISFEAVWACLREHPELLDGNGQHS